MYLDDLVMSLHDGNKRWWKLPGCTVCSNAQVDRLMFENQLDDVRGTLDSCHFQKLPALVFVILRIVAATFFESLKIRLKLVLPSLDNQTHHELWIDVLNFLLGKLSMRVLCFEHLQHLILPVSVNVNRSIVEEELHKFFLIGKLRLFAEKPEERRLVFLVRYVGITTVKQHDLNAFGHIGVIFIRQQIDENMEGVLVAVLLIYRRLVKVFQKSF